MNHVIEKLRIKIERVTERSIDDIRVGGPMLTHWTKYLPSVLLLEHYLFDMTQVFICLHVINISQDVRPE